MPLNVIDIAPIFTRISALTDSGPVVSITRPPSTHGTTRSRSVTAAKLSSIDLVVENEWSSSVAIYPRSRVDSVGHASSALGPDNARLSLRTERAGAAAVAGHDLVIRVTSWEGQLALGDEPASAELDRRRPSLRVVESTGGMQTLGETNARTSTRRSTGRPRRQDITFRSTRAEAEGSRLHAEGDLTLVGQTRPIVFDLAISDDGELSGSVVVKQTDWGMKPYSALFGAIKVKDEVLVVFEGHL